MVLGSTCLERRFESGSYGLSARRLWEHTEMGQINVFCKDIGTEQGLSDPEAFIDIVKIEGDAIWLPGLTLAELRAQRLPRNIGIQAQALLHQLDQSSDAVAFIRSVRSYLGRCAIRQTLRNQHHQFLPTAKADDAFGIPLLHSSLQRRLLSMGMPKAGAEQWLKTIENCQKKGLRAEELECSDLMPDLFLSTDDGEQFTAMKLSNLCDFGLNCCGA